MNLVEGIIQERDRLIRLKEMLGHAIELPNFFFYKAQLNDLIDRSTQAIGGNMDIVEMVRLYPELQQFEG